jgi:hypothetical protein
MRRETTKITGTTINRTLRMAQADHVVDSEIADEMVPGLIIRIRKRSAKWALRCRIGRKQYYRSIGPVLVLGDPELVRAAAERAKRVATRLPYSHRCCRPPRSPPPRHARLIWRDRCGIGIRRA